MKKIVVFGSYVTDLYIKTACFPKIGETVRGHDFTNGPGGKGSNQAVAAHRADGDVTLVTKLGRDSFGRLALDFYREEGLNTEHVLLDDTCETGCAFIMLNDISAQNQIIVNSGACGNITDAETEKVFALLDDADILLTQLETNIEPVLKLLSYAKAHHVLTVLNPAPAAPIDLDAYQNVDIITPNETETELLTGIHVENASDAEKAAAVFAERGVQKVIITLGEMGVYANDGASSQLIPAWKSSTAVDTTGAGDCFSGTFAAALSEGIDFFEAARFAVCAAGISVTRKGTAPAMPYYGEILDAFNQK